MRRSDLFNNGKKLRPPQGPQRPLPEAILPGDWVVHQSNEYQGWVEMERKVMSVPLPHLSGAERIRLHEMAHVRFSPPKKEVPEDVTISTVECIEDARIEFALNEMNMPLLVNRKDSQIIEELVKPGMDEEGNPLPPQLSSRRAAQLAVALSGRMFPHGTAQIYMDKVNKLLMPFLTKIQKRFLSEFIESVGYLGRQTVSYSQNDADESKYFLKKVHALAKVFDMLFPPNPPPFPANMIIEDREIRPDVHWGKLNIRKAKLTKRAKAHVKISKVVPVDMGIALRYPHRAIIDGYAFGQKVKIAKVNVLVDCSGSMGINHHDIEKLLELAPASTVAVYNGEGPEGFLTVVAANGMIASVQELHEALGGRMGNIVDGPALEWLGTLPGSKCWVSDGYVTGIGDASAGHLQMNAAYTCGRHGISRFNEIRRLIKAIGIARKGSSYVESVESNNDDE